MRKFANDFEKCKNRCCKKDTILATEVIERALLVINAMKIDN
jgi:hypothetical protein